MELQDDKFRDCENFNGFAQYQLSKKIKITPISVIKEGAYIRIYFTRQKFN
jgi:hypothetical protein